MLFKISLGTTAALALVAVASPTANAQVPMPPQAVVPTPASPVAQPMPPAGVPAPGVPAPGVPAPGVPAPGTPAAPVIELPPEQDMPATALPRETSIENPLGRAPAISGIAVGGYGELTLNAPSNGPAVVDLRRFVLFVGHNFNERFRFYSEVEVEHAIASSEDPGEVEIEQAYLDALCSRRFNLRAGLLLMPVGIVNVYHEPPTFNGVDRPDVDVFVIPSTWREPGIGAFGELATGLNYQLYLVNGFNANGFSAGEGIGSGHQEGMLAAARDFGAIGRLSYEPVLATVVGLSGYFATSGNSLRGTVGNVPVGMVEVDARTKRQGFTARGQLAMVFIGSASGLNQALAAGDPDQMGAVAVSSQLRGGYLEAGYDLMRLAAPASEQSVTLFARYDYVDTQASVPAGFTANKTFERHTITAGLVYRPIPHIALKGDYRRHEFGAGAGFNELAAGLGWMF